MVKYPFIILSLLCIFSECGEGKQKENETTEEINHLNQNRVVCNQILQPFEDAKLKMINACHVVFNDSINNILSLKIGSGELSAITNFDMDTSEYLKYDINNDTINIDFYFLNHPDNNYKTEISDSNGVYRFLLKPVGKFTTQFAPRLHKFTWIFLSKQNTKKFSFKLLD